MKEQPPSALTRFALYALIALWVASAVFNLIRGKVPYPEGFYVALAGFLLFAIAKISAIRKRPFSFGAGLMSPGMAIVYRIGYWLMIVGALLTFG